MSGKTVRVAAVQMNSGPDVSANLELVDGLLEEAAADGCRLAVLPENFALMPERGRDKARHAETPGAGPIQDFLARQARLRGLWLCGSLPLACGAPDKFRAACLLYDDRGRRVARYDKIHLFDATIEGDTPERYTESELVEATCWAPIRDDGRLDPAGFREYQAWNVARGLVDGELADDELFDHRFIDHANEVLGAAR